MRREVTDEEFEAVAFKFIEVLDLVLEDGVSARLTFELGGKEVTMIMGLASVVALETVPTEACMMN